VPDEVLLERLQALRTSQAVAPAHRKHGK